VLVLDSKRISRSAASTSGNFEIGVQASPAVDSLFPLYAFAALADVVGLLPEGRWSESLLCVRFFCLFEVQFFSFKSCLASAIVAQVMMGMSGG